ncbi:hypothetical protein BpHYR1_026186 [Brachionus plicatilis]|uniref:Uncharacterized protein n=1 Tax=Brachionus plicatilis TaxID=10195 RepID=A0A3M7T8L7_BRAPC|nr:hypothetical protein BpHYR1_026186 [Brachionus plicatilis]
MFSYDTTFKLTRHYIHFWIQHAIAFMLRSITTNGLRELLLQTRIDENGQLKLKLFNGYVDDSPLTTQVLSSWELQIERRFQEPGTAVPLTLAFDINTILIYSYICYPDLLVHSISESKNQSQIYQTFLNTLNYSLDLLTNSSLKVIIE